MFKQVLPKKTQETLDLLSTTSLLKNFYLSGGTCCALYLGHRISEDLDFFIPQPFSTLELKKHLSKLGRIKILGEDKNTLHLKLNQTLLSFLTYPYLLLKPLNSFNIDLARLPQKQITASTRRESLIYQTRKSSKIKISSLIDVLCTKLDTISSRGSKKDFIDLYFALKNKKFTLPQLFKSFQKKYKGIDYSQLHLLKGLNYFADAQAENMPKMLKKTSWPEIKKYIQKETLNLTKQLTNF